MRQPHARPLVMREIRGPVMAAASRRILVVDDDDQIRDVLTRFFSDAGHEVRTAADGRSGLSRLREWQPDVAFLDLEMPGMSGLDFLRHLRAEHADVTIVAFSGHSAADHLGADAKRLGAIEFFAKPFDLNELGRVVDEIAGESE